MESGVRTARFFAHTVGRDVSDWEPLVAHLLDTARLAEGFARPFGFGDLGFAAGLLHDLGKYRPEFHSYGAVTVTQLR